MQAKLLLFLARHFAKIVLAIALLTALAAGVWKIRHGGIVAGRAEVQASWDEERRLAMKAREANRDAARAAEVRHVDRERVRTEYLTITKKELSDETANMDCRLSARAIGLLNSAASAAGKD